MLDRRQPEQSPITPAAGICAGLCSRRAVLAAGAGLVGSAFVAACSSGTHRLADVAPATSAGASSATPGSTPAPAPSPRSASATPSASRHTPSSSHGTTTKPAPSTPSSVPTKSSAPPTHATPTPTQPAGTVLAQLAAVPVGGSLVVDGPNGPVAIGRPSANRVVAHTAICTHMGCTVGANGARLNCPCHGSIYDAFTGVVIQDPAPLPLAAISVRIVGSAIVTP
jgi:Rieske Fe-S protein